MNQVLELEKTVYLERAVFQPTEDTSLPLGHELPRSTEYANGKIPVWYQD